jgi:hypothetical protein
LKPLLKPVVSLVFVRRNDAKMRSHNILLLLIVVFFVVGWSLGVVLPPDPWRTWLIIITVQIGLVWYSQPLNGLISDGAQGIELAIRRRWLVVGIDLATFLLLVGYTCCKDGRWVGVITSDQENMMAATCFIEMALSFGSVICELPSPHRRSSNLISSQFHDRRGVNPEP